MWMFCVVISMLTRSLLDFCSTVDDDDQVTAEIPYTNLSDYDIAADRPNQDLTLDRNTYGRKMVEICKNNGAFRFNGRLGEDCGVYKPNTTYHTTIDGFLGSSSVMQHCKIECPSSFGMCETRKIGH